MLAHPCLGEWLGGVILFEETLRQGNSDGVPFVQVLSEKGVLVGVKTDKGLEPIEASPRETTTRGMDTLLERSKAYYAQGARFAKWCVFLGSPVFGVAEESMGFASRCLFFFFFFNCVRARTVRHAFDTVYDEVHNVVLQTVLLIIECVQPPRAKTALYIVQGQQSILQYSSSVVDLRQRLSSAWKSYQEALVGPIPPICPFGSVPAMDALSMA